MAYNNVKVKERQAVSQSSQTQQLGIVSEVPMNGWNATITYEKLNLVTHKGGTFIAKRKNTGIAPLDTAEWEDVWMPLLNGVGISSAVVEYASGSTSSAMPPQVGWSSEIPVFQAGQLLWTRLTITYTDGTQTVFYSVGVTIAPAKTSDLQNDGNDGTSPYATEAFTNSSINNLAAFYITYNAQDNAFPTKAALTGATTFYNDKKPRVPTTNDYAIVRSDESQPKNLDGSYPTTRYIYQGGTYPEGSWSFQYVINNTPLTQAQINALNSGITESGVAQITTNKNDIATLKEETSNQNLNIQKANEDAKNAVIVANSAIPNIEKGAANGVATLDNDKKMPLNQLPTLYSLEYTLKYASLDVSDTAGSDSYNTGVAKKSFTVENFHAERLYQASGTGVGVGTYNLSRSFANARFVIVKVYDTQQKRYSGCLIPTPTLSETYTAITNDGNSNTYILTFQFTSKSQIQVVSASNSFLKEIWFIR